MKRILFVLLLISVVVCSGFDAQAFRCGNEIVGRWDTAASAQVKCGKPFDIGSGYQNIKGVRQYVHKQFFNCGENDFIYSISILDEIIVSVDVVQRGTGKGQCNK